MTAAFEGDRMIAEACFWYCSVMLKSVKMPVSDISSGLHYSDWLFFLDAKDRRSQQLDPCILIVPNQGLTSASYTTFDISVLLIRFVLLQGEGFAGIVLLNIFSQDHFETACALGFFTVICKHLFLSIHHLLPMWNKVLTQTVKPTLHVTPFSNCSVSSLS